MAHDNKKNASMACACLVFVAGVYGLLSQDSSKQTVYRSDVNPVSPQPLDVFTQHGSIDVQVEKPKVNLPADLSGTAAKAQFRHASEQYAVNIQFPKYSKPLFKNDWALMNPRPFVTQSIPLDVADGVSASIVLDSFIVHRDQDLAFSVVIENTGASDEKASSVVSFVDAGGQLTSEVHLESTLRDDTRQTFKGTVSSDQIERLTSGEAQLFASIDFESGEQALLSSSFKLVGTDATLIGLGESYIDGSHLIISALFDVEVSGQYQVQANLFDQTTGEPVSHLSAKVHLTAFQNEGFFKVHVVTLREMGFEGPYILKDFNITRSPAKPGDKTGYGRSQELEYSVPAFDLDAYAYEEYQNPINQKRLAFLQKIANES